MKCLVVGLGQVRRLSDGKIIWVEPGMTVEIPDLKEGEALASHLIEATDVAVVEEKKPRRGKKAIDEL
jgi:hypothetical protein